MYVHAHASTKYTFTQKCKYVHPYLTQTPFWRRDGDGSFVPAYMRELCTYPMPTYTYTYTHMYIPHSHPSNYVHLCGVLLYWAGSKTLMGFKLKNHTLALPCTSCIIDAVTDLNVHLHSCTLAFPSCFKLSSSMNTAVGDRIVRDTIS